MPPDGTSQNPTDPGPPHSVQDLTSSLMDAGEELRVHPGVQEGPPKQLWARRAAGPGHTLLVLPDGPV